MIKTEAYTTYLQEIDKQGESTIKGHLQNMANFTAWAKSQAYEDIERLTYLEILNYVQEQKQRGLKVQTIKLRLNSISKYYEYLKHIDIIDKNPTRKIKLKGQLRSITQNVLTYTELEQLYNDYLKISPEIKNNPLTPYVKQKKNVVLGLMLWQGAISGEINKMTLEHVNLDEGTIYIPKKGRGAGRELKLLPKQVLQLYQYINEARPKLLRRKNSPPLGELEGANELITGGLHDQCGAIIKQLRGINQKVNNAAQLRASIIIHWIKVHGKRQAQYMAGHKRILSTERFELQELDSLKDSLLKHHPFS
jgi:site-specific recombinase XerD